MKKNQTTRILVAVAALLVLSLALAFADDAERIEIKAVDKKVMVLDGGGEPQVIRLEDLEDGESREFAGEHGKVTVTRRGDTLEITTEGEVAGARKLFVTAEADEAGNVVVLKRDGDAKAHVYTVKVDGDGDATWTTTEGDTVHLEMLADAMELHGEPGEASGHVIIRRDGGESQAFSFVGDDDHLMWIGEDDGTVYRCADDGIIVSGPAEKLDKAVVTCPVCGRSMTKVKKDAPHFKHLQIITEKEKTEK